MPPRPAARILGCLLSETDKEAVLGDLAEERALRWRPDAAPNEAWWYWSQISRSVPSLLWAAARRGRWIGIVVAAIAAYAVVRLVESAALLVLGKVFAPEQLAHIIISLLFAIAAMVLGGYVAARIRRGAAGALAVITTGSVIALMIRSAGNVPIWYSGVWLIICPVTALAGGALARKSNPDRSSA
ncbi:MAG: hypothetical protein ACREOG_20815 [Gemmatimonadaceae bacterium]